MYLRLDGYIFMNEFLLETHAHTSEVSPCAYLTAEETVSKYIVEDYNGLVVTNHLSANTFMKMPYASWREKTEYFLKGYRNAKHYAQDIINIFLGVEISFPGDPNDYLVYGMDEDFLLNQSTILELGLNRFKITAEENNLLIFQAHPFRCGMRIAECKHLDGIEVYNGNSSHNSNNDIADYWAETNNLRKLSGSDFHCYFGMQPGGILLKEKIKTNAELVEVLRKGEYTLI